MRLRHGVHAQLEEAATEMIRKSLEGVTARKDKADILTPWKEKDRYSREVYTSSGVADGSLRRGMYHRAWNPDFPHLNSRDGMMPPRRVPTSLAESTETPEPMSNIRSLRVQRSRSQSEEKTVDMPEAENAVVSGRTLHIVEPICRWGSQKRFKCQNCTCYMAVPPSGSMIVCKRCRTVYQPYGEETYSMVVPDDLSA